MKASNAEGLDANLLYGIALNAEASLVKYAVLWVSCYESIQGAHNHFDTLQMVYFRQSMCKLRIDAAKGRPKSHS